jgi:hypothetical protein
VVRWLIPKNQPAGQTQCTPSYRLRSRVSWLVRAGGSVRGARRWGWPPKWSISRRILRRTRCLDRVTTASRIWMAQEGSAESVKATLTRASTTPSTIAKLGPSRSRKHGDFYVGQCRRDPPSRGLGRPCGGLPVTHHPAGRGWSRSSLSVSSRSEGIPLRPTPDRAKAETGPFAAPLHLRT